MIKPRLILIRRLEMEAFMGTIRGKFTVSRLLVIILALAAVPLMVGLVGCGDDEDSVSEVINEAVDEIDETIDEAVDDVTGDTTTEVTGFTCPVTPDADTGELDSSANVFASVNVTIKNEGDSEQVTGSSNYKLEDEDGTLYDANISFAGANALGAAETLAAGDEISGVLIFEVPSGAKPKYLVEESLAGDTRTELPEAS
jgi:hypothetical protein